MMNPDTSSPQKILMGAIAPEVRLINAALQRDLEEATCGTDPLLSEIVNYGIFNGGKRLRPLLLLLAARLCAHEGPGKAAPDIYPLAIAFEYLHTATLFHDDVIDRADMRRGRASVNKEYGPVAAILGGDFLHSRSMFLVGTLGGKEALKTFCGATNAMVDGEFQQLRNAQNYNLSEEDYFEAVMGKTALLIAATCEIGAQVSMATPPQRKALAAYGTSLGTAFQIVDDLLDYQGESQEMGKAVGNDFMEGKMTLPLILAIAAAPRGDKDRLLSLVGGGDPSPECFAEAYALIEKYKGFTRSRRRAESIVSEAIGGLEMFTSQGGGEILTLLRALAQYVLARKK